MDLLTIINKLEPKYPLRETTLYTPLQNIDAVTYTGATKTVTINNTSKTGVQTVLLYFDPTTNSIQLLLSKNEKVNYTYPISTINTMEVT